MRDLGKISEGAERMQEEEIVVSGFKGEGGGSVGTMVARRWYDVE